MSDIDTAVVDSLKVLDPNRPTREATIQRTCWNPITCRSLSAAPTPGMLNRFRLGMRLQEMVEDMQQGQDVLFIAASLGLPNIFDNYVPDFVAAVLLRQKVLSECGCSDFGKMLVLCNGEHFLFGQAT